MGSHCTALDKEGLVYTWGVAQASGQGTAKHVLNPKRLKLSRVPILDDSSDDIVKVKDIACGSCFSVAVTESGEIYSWGLKTCGRYAI